MPDLYPPVGFHFRVEVLGLGDSQDVRFKQVKGLAVEFDGEDVAEGGQNRWLQKFPVRTKYSEVTLVRGLAVGSGLIHWARTCLEDFDIEPRDVDVQLLDEERKPLVTWHLYGAYPTKWSVSDLDAMANSVSIETLKLYFRYFTVEEA